MTIHPFTYLEEHASDVVSDHQHLRDAKHLILCCHLIHILQVLKDELHWCL